MAVFNNEYEGLAEAILTPVMVCEAVDLQSDVKVKAVYRTEYCMWDTGATNSLISQDVVDKLGLKPYGKSLVSDNTTVEERDTYMVHIVLPTGNTALNVECMLTMSDDYDVVIGMDIITQGDFVLTNAGCKSVFSFRRPSKEHIQLKD